MTSAQPELFGLVVGLAWVVMALVMAFKSPYRNRVPHKFSNGFFAVGAGVMLFGYTSYSWAGVWTLAYGLFLPAALLIVGVVGFRWIRREYLPQKSHTEITS